MLLNSPLVDELVAALRGLPGIGKRSAERLALHVLSAPPEFAETLSEAIRRARDRVTLCSTCFNLTEIDPCSVCADADRERETLCVVERPAGAMAVEAGGAYKGLYHVLHGALSPLEGIGPDELRIGALMRRLREGGIEEVIVATNATNEGDATALYLSHLMGELDLTVTRIAHGVPTGGGLEYADAMTLTHAIQGRRKL
jgi:recombination protein RecR